MLCYAMAMTITMTMTMHYIILYYIIIHSFIHSVMPYDALCSSKHCYSQHGVYLGEMRPSTLREAQRRGEVAHILSAQGVGAVDHEGVRVGAIEHCRQRANVLLLLLLLFQQQVCAVSLQAVYQVAVSVLFVLPPQIYVVGGLLSSH